MRERFARTAGQDPIFRTNDGSNCEGAVASTLAGRRRAFSLLLTKGLIRVGLNVPANAEFDVVDVDDPYRCNAPLSSVSMYRRPLPTANLKFLSTVMWDGRQTLAGKSIADDLVVQAREAVTGHAEGAPPSEAQLRAIVDFELGVFTAQTHDEHAGRLSEADAHGGPRRLIRAAVLHRHQRSVGHAAGGTGRLPGAVTRIRSGGIHAVRRMASGTVAGTPGDRTRRGVVQQRGSS